MLDSTPKTQRNLEKFKVDVESRASDLEVEVKRVREYLKSIQELLGLNLEESNAGKT
jgi:hypothetical protein